MRTLFFHESLMYYDQPILFVARDKFDLNYLCLLVETSSEKTEYLCIPISKQRLENVRNGNLALREALSNPEEPDYLRGIVKDEDFNKIETFILEEGVEEEWFPEPDIYLSEQIREENIIIDESINRQKAIIHCSLNPPEAVNESKITVNHLSDGVRLFQRLIKYSYEKSLIFLTNTKSYTRKVISSPDNFNLEVFATSRGSFTLHMQTVEDADFLGFQRISGAMEIIDLVNSNIEDQEMLLNTISKYGGHLVTAYKDLLKYIDENNIPLYYEWAMPSSKSTIKHRISPAQAKIAYKTLAEKKELSSESIRIVGCFNKIDEIAGTWRMKSIENEKTYFGESRIDLAGVTIETQTYELHCEEVLVVELARNTEKKKLFINSLNRA